MTLRAKTLLVVGLTLLGLVALLYLTANVILLAGFARLEAQEVGNNVQRVQDALADNLAGLNTTAADYAAWDDTYAFAADGNPAYAEDNLGEQTFANLRLNVLVILGPDGALRYGSGYDDQQARLRPLPASLEALLVPGNRLLAHADETSSLTGLVLLPEGPLLVASRPVLTSDYAGPVGGTLLIGRYLDADEVARLAQITHLDLLVEPLNNPTAPADLLRAVPEMSEAAPIFVRPLDTQSVAGYVRLPDLYGTPSLILRVTLPRAIYQEGQASVAFFLLALLVVGLVFGLTNWLLLERFVLSRLARLSQGVQRIDDRADASLRVTLDGQDELSGVAAAINGMLETLGRVNAALRASEEKFRKLAETSAAAIFIAQGSRTRYANSRAEILTGYTRTDLLAMPFHTVVPPAANGQTEAAENGSAPGQREIELANPRGSAQWLEVTAGPIDFEGEPAVIATAYDITERKRAQEGLLRANTSLTSLVSQLEAHNRESALLSQMSDLLQACPSVEESYGVIAQFLPALFPGQASGLFLYRASRDHLGAVATAGDFPTGVQALNFAPDACWSLRLGRVYSVGVPGAGPACSHVAEVPAGGYVCVPIMAQGEALGVLHLRASGAEAAGAVVERLRLAELVGERLALALANANLREALRHQAIRDPLTGLFNRRYMQETLEREVSRSARSQRPLSILFLDLDHFKRFNDTHGHGAGDALLREFGHLLRTRLRAEDIVCRYGGEEFLLIMPETTLAATLERAETLRTDCKTLTVRHYGQVLGAVTISIGVALYPDHGATGELVIRAADQALYRAKGDGRDCVRVAESA